jgi:hypothetical protein
MLSTVYGDPINSSKEAIEKEVKRSLGAWWRTVQFPSMFLEQCEIAIEMGYLPPVPLPGGEEEETDLLFQGDHCCCTLGIQQTRNENLSFDSEFRPGWYGLSDTQTFPSNPYFTQIREINSRKELVDFMKEFSQVIVEEETSSTVITYGETKSCLFLALDNLPHECIPISWG